MSNTVLFDLDGTLIDTEKIYRIYWKVAAKDCGYEFTDEQVLSLRSLGRPFAPERINAIFNDETAYTKIRSKRMEMMNAYFAEHPIELKPFAKETLEGLKKKGYNLAITTANDEQRAHTYLGTIGLLPYFDHIVCATMVKQGKPAPDVYLYACENLGVNPKETYAVEDSPNGCLSAYRAGCKVIMVPDQTQPDEKLKKILTKKIDSLIELLDYL